ncbi:hypothetical protein LTR17_013122 [Elasticomyces elasticus]|nr:hypothetical protein LTR17_013122 [Elasticomyces elasticus]
MSPGGPYSIPGVRKRVRWSSRQKWVYEDGSAIPENELRKVERYVQESERERERERRDVRPTAPAVGHGSDRSGTTATAAVTTSFEALRLEGSADVRAEASTSRSRGDGQGSSRRVVEERRPSFRSEQRPPARDEASLASASRSRGDGQGSARRVVEERRPSFRSEQRPLARNENYGRPNEQTRAARTQPEEPEESSSEESSNEESSNKEESGDDERSNAEAMSDIYETHTHSREPYRHYVIGRVIERRLRQRPANTATSMTAYAGTGGITRRFVVVRSASAQHSTFDALPIKTYNGQGVAAQGVIKAHHAVIYTMPIRLPAPRGSDAEQPQRIPGVPGGVEAGMQAQAILVIPSDETRPLDPMSRLDFFDRQTFDINIADVRIYGRVEQRYVPILLGQYHAVWASIQRSTGLPNPATAPLAAARVLTNTSARTIVRTTIDQGSAAGPSNTSARPSDPGARVTTAQQSSAAGPSTTGARPSGSGARVITGQPSSRAPDERVAQPTDQTLPRDPPRAGRSAQRGITAPQSQVEDSTPATTRSRQLTLQEMTSVLDEMAAGGRQRGYTAMPTLNNEQIMRLAQNPAARDQWLGQVRACWAAEQRARQP